MVAELDDAVERQTFMEQVFEAFGVRCEELSFHCSLLEPTSSLLTDAFPAIPEGQEADSRQSTVAKGMVLMIVAMLMLPIMDLALWPGPYPSHPDQSHLRRQDRP